jgi:glycine betaine/proline transport system substrate-binding protein
VKRKMPIRRSIFSILTVVLVSLTLISAAAAQEKPTVKIAYVEWSSSIASAHMVQAVVQERLGYPVELLRMEADQMWQAVAAGEADLMLSAWLPVTHKNYFDQHGEKLVDLGPNLTGARIGLVVPDVSPGRQTGPLGQRSKPYIETESIAELNAYAEQFRRRIVGIDPEAGVMKRAREAIKAYGLEGYRLIDGSEVSMTAELSNAIRHKKWIVVTGWTPHWMFARWNLRFLDDPQNIFGGAESIHTMVRPGLKEEMPEVVAFLDRFAWTPEEASQFMIWNQADEGLYPYEKALRWMRIYPERVDQWLGGVN